VWLPSQVATLTDQHESFVQTYVQALAFKVYRHEEVRAPLRPVVEQAWRLLPAPTGVPQQGLPSPDELNFFEPTETWRRVRLHKIRQVADALAAVAEGRSVPEKVIAKRYAAGLNDVGTGEAAALKEHLEAFLSEA
jgi:hypothetical protein